MRMKHLYRHRSACRFLSTSKTMCSKAFSSIPLPSATNESSAKVIYSVAPAMGHHDEEHDDCNFRVTYTMSALEKAKLTPKFRGSEIIQLENFRTATVEDIASIHSRSYISSLEKFNRLRLQKGAFYAFKTLVLHNVTTAANEQAKASLERGILRIADSGPTYVTATTFGDALVAVGAALSLVDYVVAASKVNENPPVGFALIRPAGHHAVPSGSMGFCFFGNVAIAARYVQRVHGLKRVFIIDFDVHHGNGTNDAFYDDPDKFFLSTHQEECYPRGTGKIDDIGCGKGEGATLNLPLPKRTGDISMRTMFDEVIPPAAQRFKPDIILVSAGYDGHLFEPSGRFQLKTGTYHMLTSNIKQLAKDLCGGRCVFFLEGGCNIYTLSHCVAQSFRALVGEPSIPYEVFDDHDQFEDEPSSKVNQAIEKIKHLHNL